MKTEEGGARSGDARPTRPAIRSFRDLEVYQRVQQLMARTHRLVLGFPDHERYGLTDQMRRASKSCGALIAEGWGLHQSAAEFKNYLRRSKGSANEMEAHLETAVVLEYVTDDARALIKDYAILAGQLHRLAMNWRSFGTPPSSILRPPSRGSGAAR